MVGLRMAVVARFLMELAMLTALAWAGARLGEGATAWLLGVGLPLVAVLVWQAFVAPKARRPVSLGVRVVIEVAIFGVAALTTIVATAATQGIESPWDVESA